MPAASASSFGLIARSIPNTCTLQVQNARQKTCNVHNAQKSGLVHKMPMLTSAENPPNTIRKWRLHRKLSQEALAEMVGTTGGMIHQIETGKRALNTRWLAKIAPALGTTPGALLDKDPSEDNSEWQNIWKRASAEDRQRLISVAEALIPFHHEPDTI